MKTYRAGNQAGGRNQSCNCLNSLASYVWPWVFWTGEREQPSIAVGGYSIPNNLAIYLEFRMRSGKRTSVDPLRTTTATGRRGRSTHTRAIRRPVVNIGDGSTINQIVPGSDILRILAIQNQQIPGSLQCR